MKRIILGGLALLSLAIVAALSLDKHTPLVTWFEKVFIADIAIYTTQNPSLRDDLDTKLPTQLGWRDLLPKNDLKIVEKYQAKPDQSVAKQVLQSILASTDDAYKATMISTQTVASFNQSLVSIPGFIVPLELNENREITRFFLVPYFGACIHFPPPPPNQILYASVSEGLSITNIDKPYQLTGILSTALYEDQAGTSAYMIEVATIEEYKGEPDDVRQHNQQGF